VGPNNYITASTTTYATNTGYYYDAQPQYVYYVNSGFAANNQISPGPIFEPVEKSEPEKLSIRQTMMEELIKRLESIYISISSIEMPKQRSDLRADLRAELLLRLA